MSNRNFCTKCGASLDAGHKFCTICGNALGEIVNEPRDPAIPVASPQVAASPIAEPIPQPEVSAPAPVQVNSAQSTPAPRSKRRAGAVIAVLSVVSVAAIALVVLIGTGVIDAELGENPKRDGQATAESIGGDNSSSLSSERDSETEDTTAEETSQETLANTGDSTEAESQDLSATNTEPLSLDNEDDYFHINLCLNNFSEIDSIMNGYRSGLTDSYQLFYFVNAHAVLNRSNAVQLGKYWPSSGGGPYYSRASFDSLKEYAELFLKETLTMSDLPPEACYEDGYVYIDPVRDGPEDEWGVPLEYYPEGVALATGLEYLGNNQYQIEFEIYRDADGATYDVTDESYYHMAPQELAAAFDQRFPSCIGTAVLETGYDDETVPFKVLSYDSIPV